MIRVADNINQDGHITQKNYLKLFEHKDAVDTQNAITDTYHHITGMIGQGGDELTAADLKEVFAKLGEEVTDEEIAELIHIADLDDDGYIGLEDFTAMCNDRNPGKNESAAFVKYTT